MNEITNSNLDMRLSQIVGRLGVLAYRRREYTLGVEEIDAEVAQMEAQKVMIEATRNDLAVDQANEEGRLEKERAHAKEARSERAKAAAEKKKRAKTQATSRGGKGSAATRSRGHA